MAKKHKASTFVKPAEAVKPAKAVSLSGLYLLAAAWLLPFLNPYHAFPLPNFYTEYLAIAAAMLALFTLAQSRVWREGLWVPQVILAPLLFILVLIIQILGGENAYAETAWQAILYLLWVCGLIWLGAALKKQLGLEAVACALSWAALAGGTINALIGLVQYLHWQGIFGFLIAPAQAGAVYGNLAQANHYANYLSMALAGLLYLHVRRRIAVTWAVACGLFLLLGMSLSGSRSTWVYLLLFAVVAFSLYRRNTDPSAKLLRRALLVVVPLYAGFLLALMYLPHLLTLPSGLTTGERLADMGSAVTTRLFLWRQAWHMFLDAPMFGVGWGEFTWQFFLRFSDMHNTGVQSIDPNAHNLVLHLLATTGLLGTSAVMIPLGIWLWHARKLPVSPETWWLISLLMVQAVHGLLEYNLWYAQFLGIAALLLGLGETAEFRFPSIGRKWLSWFWLTVLLSGSALLLEILQDYRTLEGWVYSGRNYTPGDTNARRMQEDLLQLQAHSLFRPFVELSHPELSVPATAPPAQKLVLDLRAMRFAPNSELVYRHAMMLASNGLQEEAKLQLQRAIAVYPNDLGLFVQRIKVLAQSHPELFGTISRIAQESVQAQVK